MMYNQIILFIQNNKHFVEALLGLTILALVVTLVFTKWCAYCHPDYYVTGVEGKAVGSKPQRPPPPYPVVVETTRVCLFFLARFGIFLFVERTSFRMLTSRKLDRKSQNLPWLLAIFSTTSMQVYLLKFISWFILTTARTYWLRATGNKANSDFIFSGLMQ